jgi:LytS/YehU family sensor histidine kinase
MLKYQFHDSAQKEVRLNDDIRFLTDFLNLEKIRRDHFEFTVTVIDNMDGVLVPPLLFIPFVENAVKHSADAVNVSYVHICFSLADHKLHFTCRNSKPLQPRKKSEYSGIGLVNIKRRLSLLYDKNHLLEIGEDNTRYTVQLAITI